MSQKLYEQDFYAWTLQQAELLRSQTHQDLDWVNLAEELEDMGKNLKRELESRLKVLFAHLLKWQYQPSHRGHSCNTRLRNSVMNSQITWQTIQVFGQNCQKPLSAGIAMPLS